MKQVLRGEIYYANLDPVIGSEESGTRPVLVVQDNRGTKNCPTCLVAPITRKVNKKYNLYTHVYISPRNYLKHYSVILLEQIRVISKTRLMQYLGKITHKEQQLVNEAILNTFNLNDKEINVNEK